MAENEKKDNNKGILIALILLLLAANIGQFLWSYFRHKEQVKIITEQKISIDTLQAEKTVQLAKLDQLERDLALAIEEKEKLGIDVESLKEDLNKLRKDKAYYSANFIRPSVRKEMEAKIANYELMLNQQNEEIRLLKARNDSLFKNTIELKNVIVTKNDSIHKLEKVKIDQDEELEKGRTLRANEFSIKAIKNPDKNRIIEDYEQTYKNKEMVQTLIEFSIDANPIAFIEEKQIYVQISGPDKKVIYNTSAGGGSFKIDGQENYYSIKQNIMYKREVEKMTLIFDKPTDFSIGRHDVKVWCEGKMIGSSYFMIK